METAVRLHLFGPPVVEHGGALTPLSPERRHQLCALLALRRAWVPRAEIAALLWPEQEARLAYTNLRKTLFRLQALPWAAAVESSGAALRFEPATDVAEFEAALREGRGDAAVALGARGELLAGFDDGTSEGWTRWLGYERERLRGAWRGAALARLAGEGAAAPALVLAAQLLERDPLDEAALREQMRWLARDGQAGAARAAYRAFAQRLAEDLGIEPGAELRALHDSLAAAATLPPAAPAAPATPTMAADDSFVGRSVERRRIADLLMRDECRLLCLIGPGGVGKTRLSKRVATELADRFADGTRFVPLEEIDTPGLLAARLAREAGAPRGVADAWGAVIAAWRERHLLLVLDNFEQLVAHAPLLERLLAGCPRLKLVVTSRVRLAVADEWSMPIEGLPYPDPEDDDRAEAFDAVRLFIAAARRIEPAFEPLAERAAVVDICRQVEGLPLALELAAAWVRVLPCREIAAELRHGTELLRATEASHQLRHASIEQVFEQSWRRLAASERAVLARLAVFQGGFTVEAARAVAGAALPVLGALTDKSLLRKDGERMRMHPLMQQACAAKLDASGERAATEAAHAAFFAELLARLRPAIEDGARLALAGLDHDFDNAVRAWAHAVAGGDAAALRRMARSLLNYCDYRGRYEEGLQLLRGASEAPVAAADLALRALLSAMAAHLEYRLDRYAQAEAAATEALALARRSSEPAARMQAFTVLASCALRQNRLDAARRHFRQALAASQDEPHQRAATLDNLALVEKRLGRYAEALRLSSESLLLHRRIGDSAGVALCLNNLGSLHNVMHNHAAAQSVLDEGLAICERDGLVATRALILANLADQALHAGELDASAQHAQRALDAAQTMGHRFLLAWLGLHQARLALRRGDLADARRALAGAAETALALGVPSMQLHALLVLGELFVHQGEVAAARRVLDFGATHPAGTAMERDELRSALQGLKGPPAAAGAWPGFGLDELMHRVVLEAPQAHAALIEQLRS